MTATTEPKKQRPRYGWNYQAIDAFTELIDLYCKHQEFLEDLDDLFHEAPNRFKTSRIDPFFGPIPKGQRTIPSIAAILILFEDKARVYPGNIDQVNERYRYTYKELMSVLSPDDPWVIHVEQSVDDWGLRAPWGPGAFVELMLDRALRVKRSEGDLPNFWPSLWVTWSVRSIPQVTAHIDPPFPRPGLTEAQWAKEIDQYRLDGLQMLRRMRKLLPETNEWTVLPSQLKLHVQMLFQRITIPYPLPEEMARDYGSTSVYTIRSSIRKTAKLLAIEVPRGPRRGRDQHRHGAFSLNS